MTERSYPLVPTEKFRECEVEEQPYIAADCHTRDLNKLMGILSRRGFEVRVERQTTGDEGIPRDYFEVRASRTVCRCVCTECDKRVKGEQGGA